MNANTLGTKAAVVVDATITTTVKTVATGVDATKTFWSAFSAELSARRAARKQLPVAQVTEFPVINA